MMVNVDKVHGTAVFRYFRQEVGFGDHKHHKWVVQLRQGRTVQLQVPLSFPLKTLCSKYKVVSMIAIMRLSKNWKITIFPKRYIANKSH